MRAYDPNDLFLLTDKNAGTTFIWYGVSSPSYTLLRDTTPTFATGAPIYTGPATSTTDPANASYFYLVIAP